MSNNSSLVADKLVNNPAITHRNYWSPLACLVEEQEDNDNDHLLSMRTEIGHLNVDHFLSITTDTSKPTTQNKIAEKMEEKNSHQNRHLGHRLHLGSRGRDGYGLIPRHRPPVKKGIHATGQIKNTGNKNDALEAQSPGGGRRDEHSAKSALFTDKCAKDGRARVHCSIRQKGG
jgi:hypothetical protein